MPETTPRMTRQHFEFIADQIGPHVSWPSHLHDIAGALAATNPMFNKNKFIVRATKAWEDNNLERVEIDDEIIF
jgi:hypothetical protein